MSDNTKIEWSDATWNVITGCSVVSAGCKNCYAMKLAGTRLQHHPSRDGLTTGIGDKSVWNGQVRFNEYWLDQPLKWKRPRMIFVCAHGDLFHESVPDEWIDRVFAVMALSPWHTFQVLTKRPERMLSYLSAADVVRRICVAAKKIHDEVHTPDPKWPEFSAPDTRAFNAKMKDWWSHVGKLCAWVTKGGMAAEMFQRTEPDRSYPSWVEWPRSNVWIGVSIENQHFADMRIPLLLETPAAVRWISAEPLLGPLDLEPFIKPVKQWSNTWLNNYPLNYPSHQIDWVVAGGESGAHARPMHPEWARSLRDQCSAAEIPFLFKQWGEYAPTERTMAEVASSEKKHVPVPHSVRQPLPVALLDRVGKKAAGRTLDGRTWDEYPK